MNKKILATNGHPKSVTNEGRLTKRESLRGFIILLGRETTDERRAATLSRRSIHQTVWCAVLDESRAFGATGNSKKTMNINQYSYIFLLSSFVWILVFIIKSHCKLNIFLVHLFVDLFIWCCIWDLGKFCVDPFSIYLCGTPHKTVDVSFPCNCIVHWLCSSMILQWLIVLIYLFFYFFT